MGLQQSLAAEPIKKLTLREAILVDPSVTIREAAQRMRAKRLGCVIIVDATGVPIGDFTERELIQILATKPAAIDEPVGDHKAAVWAKIFEDEPISHALDVMQKSGLRFVCVCDAAGKAIALTGQKGLLEYVAEHFPRQVMVQRVGIKTDVEKREGA